MERNNPSAGSSEPPASGGGSSTPGTAPVDKPIGTFGTDTSGASAARGASGDPTINFRCNLTIKNGATLFGGPKISGSEFGSGENADKDVVVELEGSATLSGGANLFGGAETGGPRIGSADQSGSGGKKRR